MKYVIHRVSFASMQELGTCLTNFQCHSDTTDPSLFDLYFLSCTRADFSEPLPFDARKLWLMERIVRHTRSLTSIALTTCMHVRHMVPFLSGVKYNESRRQQQLQYK